MSSPPERDSRSAKAFALRSSITVRPIFALRSSIVLAKGSAQHS
jgi:hypothetical protein